MADFQKPPYDVAAEDASDGSDKPFARGINPTWTLRMQGNALLLTIAGAGTMRFDTPAWQVTPQGRRLTATSPKPQHGGDRLVMNVTHALCSVAGMQGPSDGYAVLLIGKRRALTGCMVASGNRPYPGR